VPGRVIEQVGQTGATRSGAAVERRAVVVVAARVDVRGDEARVAGRGATRVAAAGSTTSKPCLRRIAVAAAMLPVISSAGARRP